MMTPWDEVVKKEQYKSLSPEDKLRARDQYFTEMVQPEAEAQHGLAAIPQLKLEFNKYADDLDNKWDLVGTAHSIMKEINPIYAGVTGVLETGSPLGAVKGIGEMKAVNLAYHTLGAGLGVLNSPLAFLWGSLSAPYADKDFNDKSVLGQVYSSIKEGARSAFESATKEGSFGTMYGEYYKHVTGKTIEEDLPTGLKPYAMTIEMLANLVSDPLISPAKALTMARALGKAAREWAKIVPMTDRLLSQIGLLEQADKQEIQELQRQILKHIQNRADYMKWWETNLPEIEKGAAWVRGDQLSKERPVLHKAPLPEGVSPVDIPPTGGVSRAGEPLEKLQAPRPQTPEQLLGQEAKAFETTLEETPAGPSFLTREQFQPVKAQFPSILDISVEPKTVLTANEWAARRNLYRHRYDPTEPIEITRKATYPAVAPNPIEPAIERPFPTEGAARALESRMEIPGPARTEERYPVSDLEEGIRRYYPEVKPEEPPPPPSPVNRLALLHERKKAVEGKSVANIKSEEIRQLLDEYNKAPEVKDLTPQAKAARDAYYDVASYAEEQEFRARGGKLFEDIDETLEADKTLWGILSDQGGGGDPEAYRKAYSMLKEAAGEAGMKVEDYLLKVEKVSPEIATKVMTQLQKYESEGSLGPQGMTRREALKLLGKGTAVAATAGSIGKLEDLRGLFKAAGKIIPEVKTGILPYSKFRSLEKSFFKFVNSQTGAYDYSALTKWLGLKDKSFVNKLDDIIGETLEGSLFDEETGSGFAVFVKQNADRLKKLTKQQENQFLESFNNISEKELDVADTPYDWAKWLENRLRKVEGGSPLRTTPEELKVIYTLGSRVHSDFDLGEKQYFAVAEAFDRGLISAEDLSRLQTFSRRTEKLTEEEDRAIKIIRAKYNDALNKADAIYEQNPEPYREVQRKVQSEIQTLNETFRPRYLEEWNNLNRIISSFTRIDPSIASKIKGLNEQILSIRNDDSVLNAAREKYWGKDEEAFHREMKEYHGLISGEKTEPSSERVKSYIQIVRSQNKLEQQKIQALEKEIGRLLEGKKSKSLWEILKDDTGSITVPENFIKFMEDMRDKAFKEKKSMQEVLEDKGIDSRMASRMIVNEEEYYNKLLNTPDNNEAAKKGLAKIRAEQENYPYGLSELHVPDENFTITSVKKTTAGSWGLQTGPKQWLWPEKKEPPLELVLKYGTAEAKQQFLKLAGKDLSREDKKAVIEGLVLKSPEQRAHDLLKTISEKLNKPLKSKEVGYEARLSKAFDTRPHTDIADDAVLEKALIKEGLSKQEAERITEEFDFARRSISDLEKDPDMIPLKDYTVNDLFDEVMSNIKELQDYEELDNLGPLKHRDVMTYIDPISNAIFKTLRKEVPSRMTANAEVEGVVRKTAEGRPKPSLVKPLKTQLQENMLNLFGRTENPLEAGWMFSDGSMAKYKYSHSEMVESTKSGKIVKGMADEPELDVEFSKRTGAIRLARVVDPGPGGLGSEMDIDTHRVLSRQEMVKLNPTLKKMDRIYLDVWDLDTGKLLGSHEVTKEKNAEAVNRLIASSLSGTPTARAVVGLPTGIEIDDEGNLKYDIAKGAAGMMLGTAGLAFFKNPKVLQALKNSPEWLKIHSTVGKTEKTFEFAGLWGKISQRLFDRFTTLKKVSPETYQAARKFASYKDQAKMSFDELKPKLEAVRDDEILFSDYVNAHRMLTRAERGIQNPGNVSAFDAEVAIKQMEAEFAKSGRNPAALQQAMKSFQEWTEENILLPAWDSGILSEEKFNSILQNNQWYATFEVLEHLPLDVEKIPVAVSGEYFSVANQKVIRAMSGTDKAITDPMEATIKKFVQAQQTYERLKVARLLVDDPVVKQANVTTLAGQRVPMLRRVADSAKEYSIFQATKQNPVMRGAWDKREFDTLNLFRDGFKETYLLPREIADSMKQLSPSQAPRFVQFMGQVFRSAATTIYLPFTISNAFRDAFMAYVTSPAYRVRDIAGRFAMDWGKGFWEGAKHEFLGNSNLAQEYLRQGGGFGYTGELNKASVAKGQLFSKSGARIGADIVTSPFQLISKISGTIELAPRLAIFQRANMLPHGIEDPALLARQGTIDFNRGGTWTKVLNQWVPFLNARVQAKVTLAQAIRRDPVGTLSKIGISAAIPGMASYAWNRLYHSDLYDDVPKSVRDNYFVIVTGEALDEKGKMAPRMTLIPKGDVGQMAWNPIEHGLDMMWGKDKRSASGFFIQYLSDLSPVPFARSGGPSLSMVASGLTPPLIKGAVENTFNLKLYTGTEVVPYYMRKYQPPELQYRDNTPGLYKAIGSVLGLSPLMVQNFAQNVVAGYGREGMEPELMLKALTGRIIRTQGGEKERMAWDTVKDIEMGYFYTRAYAIEMAKNGNIAESQNLIREWNSNISPQIKQLEDYGFQDQGGLSRAYLFGGNKVRNIFKSAVTGQEYEPTALERRLQRRRRNR